MVVLLQRMRWEMMSLQPSGSRIMVLEIVPSHKDSRYLSILLQNVLHKPIYIQIPRATLDFLKPYELVGIVIWIIFYFHKILLDMYSLYLHNPQLLQSYC